MYAPGGGNRNWLHVVDTCHKLLVEFRRLGILGMLTHLTCASQEFPQTAYPFADGPLRDNHFPFLAQSPRRDQKRS